MDSNMLVAILGGYRSGGCPGWFGRLCALAGCDFMPSVLEASQSEQKKQKKKRSIRVADEEAPMTGPRPFAMI